MGLISNVPFWIFYPSSQSLDSLTQLKGKRIAVGPEGSGARYVAERILSRAKIGAKTATLLPLAGDGAVEALKDATADVALLVGYGWRWWSVRRYRAISRERDAHVGGV
jgi:TRAP-type uncharacterized transport system substrate-binding protein